jgi:alpha-beta hydrolase superfamily lysophospholipase
MGEHSARYGELANALSDAGFNVLAPDLRGHGRSLPAVIEPGDMGHKGWQETLSDLAFLEYRITQEYDRPAILFGHSMGAMLAQEYAYTLGHRLHAMILSGSPGVFPRVPALLLSSLARFDSWRLTPASPSPLISKNLFRSNNKKFERDGDGDGGFAWLSRDKERVADYRADPLCGATLSAGGLEAMFASQAQSALPRNVQGINKNLRIYLFAGTDDPLNNQGKGLQALQKRYRLTGLQADLKMYPEGRHEMLNELNRETVIEDLLHWLTENGNV